MVEQDRQGFLGSGLCPQRVRTMRQDSAYCGLSARLRFNPLQKQSRAAQARITAAAGLLQADRLVYIPVGKGERLNVTYRSLASIVKYGRIIQFYRTSEGIQKGIYESEKSVFDKVRSSVCPNIPNKKEFKTIECSIMDVADDIAYSTYDLEDTFKAGFLDPLKILGSSTATKEAVARKVSAKLNCQFGEEDIDFIFLEIFSGLGDEGFLPSLDDHDR